MYLSFMSRKLLIITLRCGFLADYLLSPLNTFFVEATRELDHLIPSRWNFCYPRSPTFPRASRCSFSPSEFLLSCRHFL
jgi:hypothetical protein